MTRYIIIGARNLGREVFSLATQCEGYGSEWDVAGFLDDKPDALRGKGLPVGVLGSAEEWNPAPDERFVCALGDPEHKSRYVRMIQEKCGVFGRLIHPSCIVNHGVQVGEGSILYNHCVVSNQVRVGDHVTLQSFSVLGHDSVVGDFSHLSAYTFLGGGVVIKNRVTTGTRATVLPNVTVNQGATIGASALVVRNVDPGCTVFGIPATNLS